MLIRSILKYINRLGSVAAQSIFGTVIINAVTYEIVLIIRIIEQLYPVFLFIPFLNID